VRRTGTKEDKGKHLCGCCGCRKGKSQDEVTSSSEEINPIALPLLSYAWLKASVSQLVENSVNRNIS